MAYKRKYKFPTQPEYVTRVLKVWESMTENERAVFKLCAGIGADKGEFEASVVNGLFSLNLIKRTTNFLNAEEIVVLTDEGKRLRRALRKRDR